MAQKKLTREECEQAIAAVDDAGGNVSQASVALGLSRSTMEGRLRSALSQFQLRPKPVHRGAVVRPQTVPLPAHERTLIPRAAEDVVRAALKKQPHTLDELAGLLQASRGIALDAIDALRTQGLNIHEHSGSYHWSKTPAPGHAQDEGAMRTFQTDADGWIRFGFTSDNHLCSKYERLDVLNHLYDQFAEAEITQVLNAGNWIDGEASFNLHDLHTHGIENQMRYLAKEYPQRKGITTYAVAGDDHEGWYAQKFGVDVGRLALNAMTEAGRSDWVDMGYMEAYVKLEHAKSGEQCRLHLMHPGGGTAYAVSYTVQKIVEGYDGGDKPAALFAGHYHKLMYGLIRNVHCIQTGCTQDQTPFARKKKISFHLGGGTAEFKLDERTGAIVRCRLEIFNYFVKGYYNNRWNHAGGVTLADRGA